LGAALGPQLGADQVRSEIVGNTGSGTRTGTQTLWQMYVDPNGSLTVAGAQPTATGSWHIADDGQFCAKAPGLWDGQDLCQTVHKTGNTIQFHAPKFLAEMVFVPGKKI
jgi:hypothetical protein